VFDRHRSFSETQTKKSRMNVKKSPLVMKEKATEQPANNGTTRPKNPPANLRPTEGYVIEVDGKFKSEFESSEAAMKAGLELKKKYPHIQVKVYDAKERTRTLVQLTE
jgi:hypothetical protein